MLSTILSILILLLKIIGILLLIILALILLILLVPIRYEFDFSKKENEEFAVGANVRWFYFLVRAKAGYLDSQLTYSLRILGKEFLSSQEPGQRKEKKTKSKTENEDAIEEQILERIDEEIDKEIDEKIESPKIETERNEDTIEETEYNPTRTPTHFEEGSEKGKKKKEKDTEKKSLSDRLDSLAEKKDKILSFIDEYQIQKLLIIAERTIRRILKHIMPRKLEGWLKFGLDDPSLTGKITAMMAMFYPVYGKSFSFEPDFYEKCIEGECRGKGHIRIGFFLWILITLLLKKEVRKIIGFLIK